MKISCTKDEFAKMLEMCAENRAGYGGCQGCMISEVLETGKKPCSELFIDACEIATPVPPDREDDF